jgi:hypothetical protein
MRLLLTGLFIPIFLIGCGAPHRSPRSTVRANSDETKMDAIQNDLVKVGINLQWRATSSSQIESKNDAELEALSDKLQEFINYGNRYMNASHGVHSSSTSSSSKKRLSSDVESWMATAALLYEQAQEKILSRAHSSEQNPAPEDAALQDLNTLKKELNEKSIFLSQQAFAANLLKTMSEADLNAILKLLQEYILKSEGYLKQVDHDSAATPKVITILQANNQAATALVQLVKEKLELKKVIANPTNQTVPPTTLNH